jgi:hypothetical protein
MVWVALFSLQGCSWLMAVPEDEIPFREPTRENQGNRMANQVEGAEYADPTMKAKLNELPEGAQTEAGDEGRWQPVSSPVEPKEDKPFVFQTATGTKIKTTKKFDPYHRYPTAAELGISEAERIKMIKEDRLEPRQ